MSASFGNSSESSGRATSSVTRPPPVGAPSNERAVVRLHEHDVGVGEQRLARAASTNSARKLRRSASSQQMMSPVHACSDFHSALPLPDPGPGLGQDRRLGDDPRAPAARRPRRCRRSSRRRCTTISSTRPARRRLARIGRTIAPMVAASLRAGRHTETERPARALRRRSGCGRAIGASLRAMLDGSGRSRVATW